MSVHNPSPVSHLSFILYEIFAKLSLILLDVVGFRCICDLDLNYYYVIQVISFGCDLGLFVIWIWFLIYYVGSYLQGADIDFIKPFSRFAGFNSWLLNLSPDFFSYFYR